MREEVAIDTDDHIGFGEIAGRNSIDTESFVVRLAQKRRQRKRRIVCAGWSGYFAAKSAIA